MNKVSDSYTIVRFIVYSVKTANAKLEAITNYICLINPLKPYNEMFSWKPNIIQVFNFEQKVSDFFVTNVCVLYNQNYR
jgi:hypothetical protein